MPRPGELWLAAVTSVSPRSASDVPLLHWQSEGLRVPSTVRLSRIDCLEQATLRHRLGVLASEDAQRVKATWAVSSQLRF